jgi:hypothetical protein
MKLHITARNTAYSDPPNTYTYNCTIIDALDTHEKHASMHPESTLHRFISVELGELDEGLYVTALHTYLNKHFKKSTPTKEDIPVIHHAITERLTHHFTVIPIHTISKEAGDTFDAAHEALLEKQKLEEIRNQIADFLKTSLPEALRQIERDFNPPPAPTTTTVARYYSKQRLEQLAFIPPLHHHTLLTISRTDIDAFLRGLVAASLKPSSYLALTHFRDREPQLTPMALMLFLGNALSALAYPEYNKEHRTSEENAMMCDAALINLNTMLVSPYLTNPDLTSFVSTVKHHVQGLKRAFEAEVNQEEEQTVSHVTGFGSGY